MCVKLQYFDYTVKLNYPGLLSSVNDYTTHSFVKYVLFRLNWFIKGNTFQFSHSSSNLPGLPRGLIKEEPGLMSALL